MKFQKETLGNIFRLRAQAQVVCALAFCFVPSLSSAAGCVACVAKKPLGWTCTGGNAQGGDSCTASNSSCQEIGACGISWPNPWPPLGPLKSQLLTMQTVYSGSLDQTGVGLSPAAISGDSLGLSPYSSPLEVQRALTSSWGRSSQSVVLKDIRAIVYAGQNFSKEVTYSTASGAAFRMTTTGNRGGVEYRLYDLADGLSPVSFTTENKEAINISQIMIDGKPHILVIQSFKIAEGEEYLLEAIQQDSFTSGRLILSSDPSFSLSAQERSLRSGCQSLSGN